MATKQRSGMIRSASDIAGMFTVGVADNDNETNTGDQNSAKIGVANVVSNGRVIFANDEPPPRTGSSRKLADESSVQLEEPLLNESAYVDVIPSIDAVRLCVVKGLSVAIRH